MDLSAFYAQFTEEAADNVRVIAEGLLVLERAPNDRATLDGVFRAAHTIKGSARLLGFGTVAGLAHAMESLLSALREGVLALSPALNDLLLQANDALLILATAAGEQRSVTLDPADLIDRLERAANGEPHPAAISPVSADPAPASDNSLSASGDAPPVVAPPKIPITVEPPAPSAPTAPIAQHAAEVAHAPSQTSARNGRGTVRVRVDRLDRLVAVAGELTVGQQEDALHLQQFQSLLGLLGQQQRLVHALERELNDLPLATAQRRSVSQRLGDLRTRNGALSNVVRTQAEAFAKRTAATASLVDELESEVFAARLVPVATIFAPLPRALRELARSMSKQIELELRGEETEADRKVLDALSEPLMHMVRNAVDHGLETAAEREHAGKAATGQVTVSAVAEHGQIVIAVSDDGRGMDVAQLRATAVRKGLIDQAAANALPDAEALELIFMPGFSTSAIITDISGRGVGMDVVRTRMVELGGHVTVASSPGKGSTITLYMPVSLMTSQVLLVEAGRQLWALPSRGCRNLLRLERDQIHQIEGQPVLQIEGRAVPLVALADLLELAHEPQPRDLRSHVLLLGTTRPVAVLVDRLVDEREVVIKPLGPLFPNQEVASGVAPLPDGTLAVVLSVQALLNRLRRARSIARPATPTKRAQRLLVTDDSFTTRELLRSILQSAGYEVTTAVDGQDALDKLRADPRIDLVVSDVEMPRLDGFGLTSSIRADQALAHLPVIIVTSLHSDAHKRQGIVAGAQAYIVKSQFDQSNLLAAVRDLLAAAPR